MITARKTSLYTMIVLLPCTAFALTPTIRSSAARQGIQGATISTTNKTESSSAGNLLNRPLGNRGFTQSPVAMAPSKVSVDSVYEEMQQIKDIITEQLQEHKQTIEDLRAELDKKDEKIAQLEETLESYEDIKQAVEDMPTVITNEIERRGFITEENVTTKIEAVKNATVAEVQKMDFATNAGVRAAATQMKSEITTERAQELAKYAKTDDVVTAVAAETVARDAAIAGLGDTFATTAEVNNKIQNINDTIADELLANNEFTAGVLSELSEDLKTLPDTVSTLKSRIDGVDTTIANLDTRFVTPAALDGKGFAKTDDVTTAIANAKTETLTAVDSKGYALNSSLDDYAKTNDMTAAIANAKTETLIAVDSKGYALNSSLDDYAKTNDMTTAIANLDNKFVSEEGFADRINNFNFIKKDVVDEEIAKLDGKFILPATLDDRLANLDNRFVLEDGFTDRINNFNFIKKDVVDEEIAKLDGKFITPTILDGKGFATVVDLDNRFEHISDTIADDLLADNEFKGGILDGLGDEFKALPNDMLIIKGRLDGVDTTIATIDGKFGNYVKDTDLSDKVNLITDGKFVLPATLDDRLANLDNRFVLEDGFIDRINDFKFVKDTDLSDKVNLITDGKFVLEDGFTDRINDFKFVKDTDLTDKVNLITDGKFVLEDGFADRINDFKFVKDTDLTDKVNLITDGKFVLPATLDDRLANLDNKFVTNTVLDGKGFATVVDLDNRFEHISDTIADDLLADNDFKGGILDGLGDEFKALPNDMLIIKGRLDGVDTTIATIDGKFGNYVKDTDLSDKVNLITDGKFVLPATLDDRLANLDNRFVLEDGFADRINNFKFVKDTDLTDKVNLITDGKFVLPATLDDRLANLDNKFVTNTVLDGKGFATVVDLDNRFEHISDTIADDLLADNDFKGGILDGLGDEFKALPNDMLIIKGRLDGVDTTIATIDGKFGNYVKDTDLTDKVNLITDGKFVLPATLDDRLANLDNRFVLEDGFTDRINEFKFVKDTDLTDKVNLITDGKFVLPATLDDRLANLDNRFVLEDGFADRINDFKFVKDTDLTAKVNLITDGKFVLPDTLKDYIKNADLTDKVNLITDGKFVLEDGFADRINDFKFVKDTDLTAKVNLITDGKFVLPDTLKDYIKNADLTDKVNLITDGKFVLEDGFADRINDFKFVKDTDLTDKVNLITDGKFVLEDGFTDRINDFKFVKDTDLTDKVNLITDGKFVLPATLDDRLANLDNRFVLEEGFADRINDFKFVKDTDLTDKVNLITDGKFVLPDTLKDYIKNADLTDKVNLITDGKFVLEDGFADRINDFKFVKDTDLSDKVNLITDGKFVLPATLDDRLANLDNRFVLEDGFADRINNFKFAKADDVTTAIANAKTETLTAVDNKGYALNTALGNYAKIADLDTTIGGLGFAKSADVTTAIAGLGDTYASKSDFNTLNTNFATLQDNAVTVGDLRNRLLEDNAAVLVSALTQQLEQNGRTPLSLALVTPASTGVTPIGIALTTNISNAMYKGGNVLDYALTNNSQVQSSLSNSIASNRANITSLNTNLANYATTENMTSAIATAKEETLADVEDKGYALNSTLSNYLTASAFGSAMSNVTNRLTTAETKISNAETNITNLHTTLGETSSFISCKLVENTCVSMPSLPALQVSE